MWTHQTVEQLAIKQGRDMEAIGHRRRERAKNYTLHTVFLHHSYTLYLRNCLCTLVAYSPPSAHKSLVLSTHFLCLCSTTSIYGIWLVSLTSQARDIMSKLTFLNWFTQSISLYHESLTLSSSAPSHMVNVTLA